MSSKGERVFDAKIYHPHTFGQNPNIELGLRLRHRQTLGVKSSGHEAIAFKVQVSPFKKKSLSYKIKADSEVSLRKTHNGATYRRDLLKLGLSYSNSGYSLAMHGFVGKINISMEDDKEITSSLLFHPARSGEASIRLANKSAEPVEEIYTLGLDFLFPSILSLPASFFALPEEAKWRVFYDYGSSKREILFSSFGFNKGRKDGIYRASGLGFYLPFGGDVVGKKSIPLLQFSALVVLYQEFDKEISKNPALLFDFLGKL